MSTAVEQLDQTRGMKLVHGRAGMSLSATRYLFIAIDVLDPDRKSELVYLRGGGEEIESLCLRRTRNFLPRAELTPLELWKEDLPLELLPDNTDPGDLLHVELSEEELAKQWDSGDRNVKAPRGMLSGRRLHGLPTYPGHHITSIANDASYSTKGIMEVRSLAGQHWFEDEAELQPGYPQKLNALFFPDGRPIELSKTQRSIEANAVHDHEVAEVLMHSCDTGRRWAEQRLAREHVLLDTRVKHEHTYTYSPLARNLLRQLEMAPHDQGFQHLMAKSQEQIAHAIDAQNLSPEFLGQVIAAAQQGQAAMLEQVLSRVLAAQTPVAPTVPTPVVEPIAEFTCDACGESFDKSQGLAMHKNRWCKAKSQE